MNKLKIMLITIYKSWKSYNSEAIEALKTNLRKAHLMNSNEHATTATTFLSTLFNQFMHRTPFAVCIAIHLESSIGMYAVSMLRAEWYSLY